LSRPVLEVGRMPASGCCVQHPPASGDLKRKR
jgi:hypothetical protein